MSTTFKMDLFSNNIKTHVVQLSKYSDYNQNPITYGPNIVADLSTIRQSLDNLFHCKKYARRYLYDYYVPINELIGELYGVSGAITVLNKIVSYVEYNEPRVKCFPQLSQISITEPNLVKLDLVHIVEALKNENKYVYSTEITIN